MKPISAAPRTGERILIYHQPQFYDKTETLPTWSDCRWISDQNTTGSIPHWEPFRGTNSIRTTEHIHDMHCLGWTELPSPNL